MPLITREDLIEWFGTDHDLTELEILQMNEDINHSRAMIMQDWGFK